MARPISVTPTGTDNTIQDSAQSKFGVSSLDGTTGGLDLNDQLVMFDPTDVFTIEMWIYPSTSGGFNYLWNQNWYESNNAELAFYFNGSGQIGFQVSIDGPNSANSAKSSALANNTWHHVALTHDGSGNWECFVNGTSTATVSQVMYNSGTGNAKINRDTFDGGDLMNGWIDEVRASSVVRYTSNFTPPTSAFTNDNDTLMLLHMDGGDGSGTFTDDTSSPVPTPTNLNVTNITSTSATLNWSPG